MREKRWVILRNLVNSIINTRNVIDNSKKIVINKKIVKIEDLKEEHFFKALQYEELVVSAYIFNLKEYESWKWEELRDSAGNSLLHVAIMTKSFEKVAFILNKIKTITLDYKSSITFDKKNQTPLELIILNFDDKDENMVKIFNYIIKNDFSIFYFFDFCMFDISTAEKEYISKLCSLTWKHDKLKLFEILVEKFGIEPNNNTFLENCIIYNSVKFFNYGISINSKIDFNSIKNDDMLKLFEVYSNKEPEVFKLLINFLEKSEKKDSILIFHSIVRNQNVALVKYILENKRDYFENLVIDNSNKENPLDEAIKVGNPKITKLLVKNCKPEKIKNTVEKWINKIDKENSIPNQQKINNLLTVFLANIQNENSVLKVGNSTFFVGI